MEGPTLYHQARVARAPRGHVKRLALLVGWLDMISIPPSYATTFDRTQPQEAGPPDNPPPPPGLNHILLLLYIPPIIRVKDAPTGAPLPEKATGVGQGLLER